MRVHFHQLTEPILALLDDDLRSSVQDTCHQQSTAQPMRQRLLRVPARYTPL